MVKKKSKGNRSIRKLRKQVDELTKLIRTINRKQIRTIRAVKIMTDTFYRIGVRLSLKSLRANKKLWSIDTGRRRRKGNKVEAVKEIKK